MGAGQPLGQCSRRALSRRRQARRVVLAWVAAFVVVVCAVLGFAVLASASVAPGDETSGNGNDYVLVDSVTPGGPVPNFPQYFPDTDYPIQAWTDDSAAPIGGGLPFAFGMPDEFYDFPAGTPVYVSSNGLISFGSATTENTNEDLALTSESQALIVPFWDDLDPTNCFASAYADTHGTAPNRVLVIEWNNYCDWNNGGGTNGFSFQARLFETSHVIEFHYTDVEGDGNSNNGVSATVGIKGTGNNFGGAPNAAYLQYSFNTVSPPPLDSGGFAIRFTPCTSKTPTVATAAELDHAVHCYNQQAPAGNHTITLASEITIFNPLVVAGGIRPITQPDPNFGLTIDGAGTGEISGPGPGSIDGTVDLITVDSAAPVTIDNVILSLPDGIAVYATSNAGQVDIVDSRFQSFNFGVFAQAGTVNLTGVHMSNFGGSAVSTTNGAINIVDSTIDGGGLGDFGAAVATASGRLTVSASTIIGTTDAAVIVNGGSALISNSTIANNLRGAVANSGAGSLFVSNSTITSNDQGVVAVAGDVEVVSSIVAQNTTVDCSGLVGIADHNFASDYSCGAGFAMLAPANSLGPLATNGGPTNTRALIDGSNAISGGTCNSVSLSYDSAGFLIDGPLTFDQRGSGFPRQAGPRCDAGSFEGSINDDPGAAFFPLPPKRIVESRTGQPDDPADGINTPWGPAQTRTVQLTGVGGVPSDATAVVLQVTSVLPTADSYMTIWAEGDKPVAASKNYGITAGGPLGHTGVTNDLLIVEVNSAGTAQFYNNAGNVDIVIDVVGYFANSGQGRFNPLSPKRIVETRPGQADDPNDGFSTPWGPAQTRTVQLAGVGGVPSSVSAVVLQVTSVLPTADSYMTIWAEGDKPVAASKNYGITAGGPLGHTGVTNDLLIVEVNSAGTAQFYNNAGNVDIVIDVVGYVTPLQGDRFVALPPKRVVETRPGQADDPNDGFSSPWGPAQTRTVQLTNVGGVPIVGTTAVVLQVTSVLPTADSYMTIWAEGDKPVAASKNYGITAGGPLGHTGVTNDLLIVEVNSAGTAQFYNNAGNVDLVIDVVGYYTRVYSVG